MACGSAKIGRLTGLLKRYGKPSSFPLSSGNISPTAVAAPVLVRIMDCVAERARHRSLINLSEDWIVGVGMHCHHHACGDDDRVIDHLLKRHKTVGGAGGLGCAGEQSSALQNDVHAEFVSRKFRRVRCAITRIRSPSTTIASAERCGQCARNH